MMEVKKEVIEIFDIINNDTSVPKNIRQKIQDMEFMLDSKEDLALNVNKVLQELDDISEESNLPEHIRTQIWNIASLLESII